MIPQPEVQQVELLPCPFCGGDNLSVEVYDVQPDDYHGGHVFCSDCGAQGSNGITLNGWLHNPDEARAAAVTVWNTRHRAAAFEAGRAEGVREAAEVADALSQRAEAASQRAATAESRLYFYSQHRAARFKVLADFIQTRAPDLWADYAALSVNGSVYTDGSWIEPTYERAMNTLRHRAEAAEEEATKLRALSKEPTK